MSDAPLSMRTGAGLDPCGALQTEIRIAAGAEAEIAITLGQTETRADAQSLIARTRNANLDTLLDEVKTFWDETLGTIEVKTPERSMDIMLNRWLLYQTLACRMWARAGFYQASGAYGFRDQLQDSMALCVSHPELARAHILRTAARQFVEGDVQHWWLPETGKGVRTTISDDRAWLAYVVSHYLETTGDTTILDEQVPFLEGQRLKDGEHEAFFQPHPTSETATLYEHCARGLDLCLPVGAHGLPLMGTGDWNDGMNRVGENGRGESVWLGWFVYDTLSKFIPVAEARADGKRAATWLLHTTVLKESLEDNGWDGDWYRRAYYDDGTPLGSVANAECRIDSIAQSWSVLSGAAEPARAARAMQAVDKYLVRGGDQLDSSLHAAFRRHRARSRLHQGISRGPARKRRPIYPWRAVDDCRFRRTRQRQQGRGVVLHAQSHQPCPHPHRRPALPRRALCGVRRCLFRHPPCRARRMDMVFRLGGLDVSRRHRMDSGSAAEGRYAGDRSLHPVSLAAFRCQAAPQGRDI